MKTLFWTIVVVSLTLAQPVLACEQHQKRRKGPMSEETCMAFADLQMEIAYWRDRGVSAFRINDYLGQQTTCPDTRRLIQQSVTNIFAEWNGYSQKDVHYYFFLGCLSVREQELRTAKSRQKQPQQKRPQKREALPDWKTRS